MTTQSVDTLGIQPTPDSGTMVLMGLRTKVISSVGLCRGFLGTYFDRLLLAVLNAVAAVVSYSYQGTLITYPDVFAVLHATSALLLIASCLNEETTPFALAISSGTFVGRALSIWTAVITGSAGHGQGGLSLGRGGGPTEVFIPDATLLLAGLQWAALAWVIRPASVTALPVKAVADELLREEK